MDSNTRAIENYATGLEEQVVFFQEEHNRLTLERAELLNIIKQLRDYIANSDIAPEDSDRLYHEHLDLADSVLSHPESDDEEEEEEEAIRCFQCERVLKGEIAFPFDNNEGDKEEEDEDICYMCEACQWDPDYISSQEPEELEKHRAKMHTFERVAVN